MDKRYHTIVQEKQDTLFEQYIMTGGNYKFCWHKTLEIMFIMKGNAEVFADGEEYALESGDVLLINSNCGHATFWHDPESIVLITNISKELYHYLHFDDIENVQFRCVSTPETRNSLLFRKIRFLLANAFIQASGQQDLAGKLAIQYAGTLLCELMQNCPTEVTLVSKNKNKEQELLRRATEYINDRFDQKISLEEVADNVQYNRTYLSTLFKKETGLLFSDYLVRVRLRNALGCLEDTDLSIVDIALQNGFPDSKSFTASMKKYCGKTPQEYRNFLKKYPYLHSINDEDKYLIRPHKEADELLEHYASVMEDVGSNQRMKMETGKLMQYISQLDTVRSGLERFMEKRIALLILTGGASKRFGGKKKLLLYLEGETFASRIIDAFKGISKVYLSVDKKEKYKDLGLPMVEDLYPGCGPLGGIASALEVCSEEALFVVACDMPFVTKDAVQTMMDYYEEHDGIVLAANGDSFEPLFGIYPKAALQEAKKMISEGDFKTRNLFGRFGGSLVHIEKAEQQFININTPEDYSRYLDLSHDNVKA